MIDIVKRKINVADELRSKIKWACTFNNCVPMINVDSHFIFSNNPQIKLSNKTNPFQNKISNFQIIFPIFAK